MNSKFFFLFGCLPTRLSICISILMLNGKYLPYFSLLLFALGISFIVLFMGNYRKTGFEIGGKPIWWNNKRPIHGILYILAGIFCIHKNSIGAFSVILLDTMLGLLFFLKHHSLI